MSDCVSKYCSVFDLIHARLGKDGVLFPFLKNGENKKNTSEFQRLFLRLFNWKEYFFLLSDFCVQSLCGNILLCVETDLAWVDPR